MLERMSEATRERYLTARWNNTLTVALGLPTLVFAYVALATDTFSDRTAFIVLVAISAFY